MMKNLSRFVLHTCLWITLLLPVVGGGAFFAVWALDSLAGLSFIDGVPVVAALFLCLGLLAIRLTLTGEESARWRMRVRTLGAAAGSAGHAARRRVGGFARPDGSPRRQQAGGGGSGARPTGTAQNVSAHDAVAALRKIHSVVLNNPLRGGVGIESLGLEIGTKHAPQK
jgi:hypothetical protein